MDRRCRRSRERYILKHLSSAANRKPSEYVSYSTGDTGYRELGGVSVSFPFDSYVQNDIWYEVYRSTKPSGGFTKILSGVGYMYGASEVRYYDDNVKVGNTYYYMAKIVTGTDSYNKTSRVVETSAVAKVDCRLGTAELSVDRGAKGADITVSDYGALTSSICTVQLQRQRALRR